MNQILCAVLNKYYSFAHPFSPQWTFWYIREASTAIYVANIPLCWPLMRRVFNLRSFNGHSSKTGTNSHQMMSGSRLGASRVYGNGTVTSQTRKDGSNGSWWDREGLARTESEELIVEQPTKTNVPLEIWARKSFEVVDDTGRRYDGTESAAGIGAAISAESSRNDKSFEGRRSNKSFEGRSHYVE